jgi:hypothetical protein
LPGRAYRSALAHDVMPRACYECGQALAPTQRKFCSASCSDTYRAEMRRLVPIVAGSALSPAIREIRLSEEARSANLRRVSAARRAWDNTHKLVGAGGGRQAEMAARDQLRRWYVAQVQPRMMGLQPKDIVGAIEVRAHMPGRLSRAKSRTDATSPRSLSSPECRRRKP